MIILGAITPHSPLLVPRIGKDKREALEATVKAYETLGERLYALSVDTLLLISPHAPAYGDAFSINISESYAGTLKAFGDHETTIRFPSDILLLDRIQQSIRTHTDLTFKLTTAEELDYGCAIPLLMLQRYIQKMKIVPLSPSLLNARAHVDFGMALKDVLHESNKRIAIIASADLSHKLNKDAPGGFSVEGPAFDATIRNKISTMDIEGLLSMDTEAIEAAGQCGYRPILILLGILAGMNVDMKELSYEAPFGVGYLTEIIEPA
jgi:aromatic ring-opening dioxygenase LigB subunit